MSHSLVKLVAIAALLSVSAPQLFAQSADEIYDFDGVADMDPQPIDPTDWMTSENWSDGGADPLPPFGPAVPDLGTRVEIQTSTPGVNAPVIGPGDTAEAFGVRIGRFGGEGLLTMTGGTLDVRNTCVSPFFSCDSRLRVGAAQADFQVDRMPGTFDMSDGTANTDTLWIGSGSEGTMNMSGGVMNARSHVYFDWPTDQGSVLNMSGGTINVGTVLPSPFIMHRQSELNLEGGDILINGPARLGSMLDNPGPSQDGQQTPDVTVLITGGLLEASNFLEIGGSITINGGILRADSFNESVSSGTLDINSTGILQFNNAQESVTAVQALITGGTITTSGAAPLFVEIVDVGGVDFTQVSISAPGLGGDFDEDDDVDGEDFLLWQQGFGSMFDASHLAEWQGNYGMSSALIAGQAIPEPASVALAVLGMFACSYRPNRWQRIENVTTSRAKKVTDAD